MAMLINMGYLEFICFLSLKENNFVISRQILWKRSVTAILDFLMLTGTLS